MDLLDPPFLWSFVGGGVKMIFNLPERPMKIPGGVEGFSERLDLVVLTAVESNSLHFQSYAGKAYPGRLDHLMACDPRQRVHVAGSGLTFVAKLRLDGLTTAELSDRY